MLRFIVDTQLPPRLSAFFIENGFDSTHTKDYPSGHKTTDKEISAIAKKEERIIVTKDFDFFELYFLSGSPPRILLLQIGNTANNELLETLKKELATIKEYFGSDGGLLTITQDSVIKY